MARSENKMQKKQVHKVNDVQSRGPGYVTLNIFYQAEVIRELELGSEFLRKLLTSLLSKSARVVAEDEDMFLLKKTLKRKRSEEISRIKGRSYMFSMQSKNCILLQ